MHNAALNEVDDKMEVLQGNAGLLSHVEGLFDVVLANINRNVLLSDMEAFCSVMTKDATLVLSGFYKDDVPLLLDKAAEFGRHEVSVKSEGDWCCIILS